MIGDDHSTAFTVYIFYMHVLQSEIHWQVMSAMARQKSHQWTVPGFPEHVSTQEGTKNIGSNVFVKARESRYIKVTVWKYKVSFQLSMNDELSHQTWIFFCLASRPERTGTCGQTCPNDIKSLKKCLKHVKFLGDHEWDFTRAVGQQHQAINKPYASNEGEGCVLQLWAELRCYPQIPVGADMFLQITLAEIETARLGQKL